MKLTVIAVFFLFAANCFGKISASNTKKLAIGRKCRINPCALAFILCKKGSAPAPDFSTCTCKCRPLVVKPCNPCASTKCKRGFTCVADKKTCKGRCERRCRYCWINQNPCNGVTCGKNKFCLPNCNKCGYKCIFVKRCPKNPCTGARCGRNERCVSNFKDCTHTCKNCLFACPAIFAPVCGSDGKTYSNKCALERAICVSKKRLRKKHDGPCKADSCPEICPLNFAPVCGSDGKTYPNACALSVASCKSGGKIKQVSIGPCQKNSCPEICPLNFAPVCGSDGKTYSNACALTVASCKSGGKIKQVSIGPCQKTCEKPCTRELRPICGSDGVTYNNKCLFEIAVCKSNGKLTKKNDGPCKACEPCKKVTCKPDEKCVANVQQCTARCECQPCRKITCKTGYRCITNLQTCVGTCEKPCNKPCPEIFSPVCGTDGVTYDNQCFLNNAICLSGMQGGNLMKKNDGPCKKSCQPSNPCSTVRCRSGTECVANLKKCTAQCLPCEPCKKVTCKPDEKCVANVQQCTARCECQPCRKIKCKPGYRCITNLQTCVGTCEKPCNKPCPKILSPVCGTDGVTYDNECLLNNAICLSGMQGGNLMKKNDGPCQKSCNPCAFTSCFVNTICVPNFKTCTARCEPARPPCGTNPCAFTTCLIGSICVPNFRTCTATCVRNTCKVDPCALILCNANSICVRDFRTCIGKCELLATILPPPPFTLPTRPPPTLPTRPPPGPPSGSPCEPCKCRNCGINGRCVADTKDCTSVCATKCPPQVPPVFCFIAPCTINNCKKDEICVPGCAPCSQVCLKKQPTITPCSTIRCAPGYECKVDGCRGTCVKKENCNKPCENEVQLVCGSDGRVYSSDCELNNAICRSGGKLEKRHDGFCNEIYQNIKGLDLKPVCGSNGRTYSNEVFLEIWNCLRGQTVKKVLDRPCECRNSQSCHNFICLARYDGAKVTRCESKCLPTPCPRPPVPEPRFCGTDGKTYTQCSFNQAKCLSDGKLQKRSNGPCPKIKCLECKTFFQPVCGSDGMTYTSECHLKREICLSGRKKLKKLYNGPCGSLYQKLTGLSFKTVCGSDGNLYSNDAFVGLTRCFKNIVTVPCKKFPVCGSGHGSKTSIVKGPPQICGFALTLFCKKDDCKSCCISSTTCGPDGYVNGSTQCGFDSPTEV